MKASLEGFSGADRPGVSVALRGNVITLKLAASLGRSDHAELVSDIFVTPGALPGVEEVVVELGKPPDGAGAWLTSTWGAHPTVKRVRVVAGLIVVVATPPPPQKKGPPGMTRLDVTLPANAASQAVDVFTEIVDRDFDAVVIRVHGRLSDDDRDALVAAAPTQGQPKFA